MSPYDDPAVSAGEIADYLYSLTPHTMTELQIAYQTAIEAVRTFCNLAQEEAPGERPGLLLLADDLLDAEGNSCDCLIVGNTEQLFDLLANAAPATPRLAAAVVAAGQQKEVVEALAKAIAEQD